MNLLILAPHYDTFVKVSGEQLAKYSDNVTVIIPKFSKLNLFGKKISIFKSVNQTFTTNQPNVKIHYVTLSYFLPISAYQLIFYINENKIPFHIVLSHFIIPYGYLGNKVSERFNKKSVLVGHGFDVYDLPFRNLFYNKIIKSVLKHADKIITVSQTNLRFIKRLGYDYKTVVIPNGFNGDLFKPMDKDFVRKKLNLPMDKKIVLNVGHLIKIKNQRNLILAFKELLTTRKDIFLYIVGEGNLASDLRTLVNKLDLNDYVFLVGPKPHDEIPLWMNAADVFVLPSYSEGNPTVMFEALGCGLPFVGTTVGGIPEVITSDDYGFLFDDPNDYVSLSKLLDKALNKKWNKRKILNYAKKYEISNIAKKYLEVFNHANSWK